MLAAAKFAAAISTTERHCFAVSNEPIKLTQSLLYTFFGKTRLSKVNFQKSTRAVPISSYLEHQAIWNIKDIATQLIFQVLSLTHPYDMNLKLGLSKRHYPKYYFRTGFGLNIVFVFDVRKNIITDYCDYY